jgi:starch-binding outer membrane protein, SusD/RagB family
MKKLLYAILFLLPAFSACNVLDVKDENAIPADMAFRNKSGIEKGIVGCYSTFQNLSYFGRNFLTIGDLAADNLIHPADATSADFAEIATHAILPENGTVETLWGSLYEGINNANNIIIKVPDMTDMTDAEKGQALGELYFIRSLNHFNLINLFGAVPLKTKPTIGTSSLNAGRDAVDAVYAKVIEDLTYASQNLAASTSSKTRATRYAAKALLARVYLYKGDWDLAYQQADDVINEGGYQLPQNFADVFAADGSPETIFEIDFSEVDRNRVAEYNFPKSLNGRREVAPAPDLINAFLPEDERKAVSIAYDGINAYANKYNDLSKGADNLIVLRLAEMYLIRAEAEVHLPDADLAVVQENINVIRTRAGIPAVTASTEAELTLAIERERRLEFAFEGQRWYDLVRTGRATVILPTVTSITKTLFPIPSAELQTNNSPQMIQNPGY